jgi:hypothetical protein
MGASGPSSLSGQHPKRAAISAADHSGRVTRVQERPDQISRTVFAETANRGATALQWSIAPRRSFPGDCQAQNSQPHENPQVAPPRRSSMRKGGEEDLHIWAKVVDLKGLVCSELSALGGRRLYLARLRPRHSTCPCCRCDSRSGGASSFVEGRLLHRKC